MISLYGDLGQKFKDRYGVDPININIHTASVAETMRALDANFKGFHELIDANGYYKVINNNSTISQEAINLTYNNQDNHWHFMPVPQGGGKDAGPLQLVAGVALIAIGTYAQSPFVTQLGVGLLIGGAATMLSPMPPEPPSNELADSKGNFLYGGPKNLIEPGSMIPYGYGENYWGSLVASSASRLYLTEDSRFDSEDKNNSIVRLLDVIAEGDPTNNGSYSETMEPANGTVGVNSPGTRMKMSTYINEIPVADSNGDNVIEYVKVQSTATAYTHPPHHFDSIDTPVVVSDDLTNSASPLSYVVTDLDVDDLVLRFNVNQLWRMRKYGIEDHGIYIAISITPDNGAGAEQFIITNAVRVPGSYKNVLVDPGCIYGKSLSGFPVEYLVEDLSQYGDGPWVLKVYKDNEDRTDWGDSITLYSYSESKTVKLDYVEVITAGVTLTQKDQEIKEVPSRCYKMRSKVLIPSNYDPDARTYSGVWDGTFATHKAYTDNPAWCIYDLCSNDRYGIGKYLDISYIDKWKLYEIGQWCDGDVDVQIRTRAAGGGYSSSDTTEPRFTCNTVITGREQAIEALRHLTSIFNGYPITYDGMLTFIYDEPKDATRIACNSNVKDGTFSYSLTPRDSQKNYIKATYNDHDNFDRPNTVIVQDTDSIAKIGLNETTMTCFACNSRSEAIRRAKYFLYTCVNQTRIIEFTGGKYWSDALPGEVIALQDYDLSDSNLSGRIISGTTTSITIDRSVTIEGGETYTLYIPSITGNALYAKTLTNGAGATTTLTWSGALSAAPVNEQVWALTKSSVADVQKYVITNTEEISRGQEYKITALIYDENKWDVVEDGIVVDVPPATNMPVGELDVPTNVEVEGISYLDGETGSQTRGYGLSVSWTNSDDTRVQKYQLQLRKGEDQAFGKSVETSGNNYVFKSLFADNNDSLKFSVRIRAVSVTAKSKWVYTDYYTLTNQTTGLEAPTGLRCTDSESTTFNGQSCEIEWTASVGAYYDNGGGNLPTDTELPDAIAGYRIRVYTTGDSLLRTEITEDGSTLRYDYTYEKNVQDNSGNPIRQIKFKVSALDRYGTYSDEATLTASNPAPSSDTPTVTGKKGFLRLDWTASSDNDMDHYDIYLDTNNPPTTKVATLPHPCETYDHHGVDYGTTYYVKMIAADKFGDGSASGVNSGSPLLITDVDVESELTNTVTITTDASYSGTLTDLYDRDFASGGITIAAPEDYYIQYAYKLDNYFDRCAVWSLDGNPDVYFATSTDESTWEYFAGEVDGELQSYGTSQANAKSNAWTLGAGFNTALLPDNVTAQYVRMYFANSDSVTIYEFIPSRIIISELAALENLSAISVDAGTITAGELQSASWDTTHGTQIDLNNNTIKMGGSNGSSLSYNDVTGLVVSGQVTFTSGTSGYANVTDKPTALGDINSTEGTKLSGIEDGATLGAIWGSNISGQPSHIYQTFYQSAAPSGDGEVTGDIWFDSDDNKIYRYNGAAWSEIQDDDIAQALADAAAAQATADGKIVTYYQDAEPGSGMGTGDLWVDTDDDNKLYRYSGAAWVAIRDAGIAQALSDAATAQSTADGKIVTFYQDSEPGSGMSEGDLWFDTNDKNKLYRYSGAAWVAARDSDIAQAISDASTAQATADTKILTFFQDAEPGSGMSTGDLWMDTDDDNRLYRYSGAAWVEAIQDYATYTKVENAPQGTGINMIQQPIATMVRNSFESGSEYYVVGGTAAKAVSNGYLDNNSLRINSTASVAYCGLGADNTDYNIAITPGQKWIFSCYVYSNSGSGQDFKIGLKRSSDADVDLLIDDTTGSDWTRYQAIYDLSGDTSENILLICYNYAGSGVSVFFDAFMLEPLVGTTAAASQFAGGGTTIIDGGNIYTSSIFTDTINGNAVTVPVSAFTSGSLSVSSGNHYYIQTATIDTEGYTTALAGEFDAYGCNGYAEFYRDTTLLSSTYVPFGPLQTFIGSTQHTPKINFRYLDTGATGTHTYKIRAYISATSGTPTISRRYLECFTSKR